MGTIGLGEAQQQGSGEGRWLQGPSAGSSVTPSADDAQLSVVCGDS